MSKHGNSLGLGPILYSGSKDQLNQLCREKDDEIDRLRNKLNAIKKSFGIELEKIDDQTLQGNHFIDHSLDNNLEAVIISINAKSYDSACQKTLVNVLNSLIDIREILESGDVIS